VLAVEIVLAVLAAGMAAITSYLIRWAAEAKTPLRAGIVVFLLMMMVAMIGGAAIYYLHPGTDSAIEALWVASAVMSASVFAVFVPFLKEARIHLGGSDAPPPPLRRIRLFVASVIGLVLLNEVLMGWTFQAASGATIVVSGTGAFGAVQTLGATVNSPWFLFTMAAEMMLTAYFVRDRLPRPVFWILLLQAAIMALSPPALAGVRWAVVSIYGGSAIMIVLFVYLMEYIYRTRQLAPPLSSYLVRLLGVYAIMMIGLYLWLVYGYGLLFALAIALEMILFLEVVVLPERIDAGVRQPWQLRPHWTFAVLALIFVAELFMGALLDAQVLGSSYLSNLPALPLAGGGTSVLYNGFYNGFWFFALTTGSTWFLMMMGVEMGALVAFKYRETRGRETRIRLLLMLGCYGAFAVFFPSIYYPLAFPNLPTGASVPVLGWSMGIGSAPLGVSVFAVLLATYILLGSLTFLFGRRVVCSTFCTAPLMYQGTTIDSMKSFNRSSPVARKYIGSRFSSLYTATTGLVLASLSLASLASYLDQTGRLNLTILGVDPTVFLFAFYFSVLWYVTFVTIPYAGNYNCVTMGWCYTGAITQAFSRIGFFRLKVRDKEVCRKCRTVDCAKACPVGLADMPRFFREKGEFRSSKCCGVGDCVEACPYGNMYFYDVRHWFRRRLGRPEVSKTRVELPLVGPAPRSRGPTLAPAARAEGTPSSGSSH
jgi:polyferredoxin